MESVTFGSQSFSSFLMQLRYLECWGIKLEFSKLKTTVVKLRFLLFFRVKARRNTWVAIVKSQALSSGLRAFAENCIALKTDTLLCMLFSSTVSRKFSGTPVFPSSSPKIYGWTFWNACHTFCFLKLFLLTGEVYIRFNWKLNRYDPRCWNCQLAFTYCFFVYFLSYVIMKNTCTACYATKRCPSRLLMHSHTQRTLKSEVRWNKLLKIFADCFPKRFQ